MWVIVLISSSSPPKSKKKKVFFTSLNWENRHGIGEKGGYFSIGKGVEIRPLEMDRKSPVNSGLILQLNPYLVYTCSKGSGESTHLHRLIRAFIY